MKKKRIENESLCETYEFFLQIQVFEQKLKLRPYPLVIFFALARDWDDPN